MKARYFFLAILIGIFSCEEPPQPNEPFYCKINGKRWRPNSGTALYGTKLYAELKANKTVLGIVAFDLETKESIIISIKDLSKIQSGSYSLGNKESTNFFNYNPNYSAQTQENYYTDDTLQGNVVLSIKDGFLSGTFSAEVKSNKTGKTLRITKGQFNLSYNEY